jgi:hypothetical protein
MSDEGDAFLCACKGEPYTFSEWDAEVKRLRKALEDANRRRDRALVDGVCMPARFAQSPALEREQRP